MAKSKSVKTEKSQLTINDIENGDLFYELSHYVVLDKKPNSITFKHIQSSKTIELSNDYVLNLLKSGDHYFNVIKIGKEDKLWTLNQVTKEKENYIKNNSSATEEEVNNYLETNKIIVNTVKQKGIKTLWSEISANELFTVCFKKADTKKTKSEKEQYKLDFQKQLFQLDNYKSLLNNNLDLNIVNQLINDIADYTMNNPYTELKSGELRTLRGYKCQMQSDNGQYECKDLDINDQRPVNINTIQWLIYNGVKYVLE